MLTLDCTDVEKSFGDRLLFKLERNTVLARLSVPRKNDDTAELDRRFNALTDQIKSLRNME